MRRPPPHTLRGQLTAGLVCLLAIACLAVGVTTALALRGFLMGRVDQQLTSSGGRFAASLEHEAHPDADNQPDTRGQAEATFGARLLKGSVTQAAVVDDKNDRRVPLTAGDQRTLAAVPADSRGHRIRLSALGSYRVVAVSGDDGDVLITGLPLHPVEETIHHLEAVETVVFGVALLVTGIAGALWVRVSLRPLRRVTAQAASVARLPLASGEVAMPGPLTVSDPRTEVGQVATAVNQMLGHVGDALAQRHASEERLRHFAADASHELRTPVANIRGHAELALRHPEPVPAPVRHSLERVQSESQRMTHLVDDLLLLARLDAGRPLERETVDLTRLVLDATDDARAAGPGHRWLLDLPEEPVTVTGDAHRLQQVIGNLLANARAHTPSGTEVTGRLATQDTGIHLTVTDNGPGIPAELQPEVFGRFVRADHSRSRTTGSTGLGLAIVHAVVTAHGGTVNLTSTPGHTAFEVTLPR
ncbi:HAMP domain-containing sensor histidine kinase [Streptomyces sp. H10-C2]|uniref:sensor histidine kinase n=1 Tax=unclassified Streptomyces TaxID=2593676 RepID=UPI0024BB006F|nr:MULTISPECIES: HAMP domain-containing sensor histidine kinase [unclassified Streptomyces]MDJ0344733.1 HAMP domain-containing sensor histidine kinase [Streptomyces sp. PH10-H1]MDJ0371223.1 HAMP domain-containing sensor histidine kinase [Streptomyces sp. H10-C2]